MEGGEGGTARQFLITSGHTWSGREPREARGIHVRTAAKRLGSPTGRVCDARAQPRYVKEGQLQNITSIYIAKQPPLIPPQGRRRGADPFVPLYKTSQKPRKVEDFGLLALLGAHRGVRTVQDGLKTAQDGPKPAQDGPQRAHETPKTAQEGPKRTRKSAPRSQNHRFSNGFFHNLGVLVVFGSQKTMTAQAASKKTPRRPKRPPKGPHDGPREPQDRPRKPPRRSKRPPRRPKRTPKGP